MEEQSRKTCDCQHRAVELARSERGHLITSCFNYAYRRYMIASYFHLVTRATIDRTYHMNSTIAPTHIPGLHLFQVVEFIYFYHGWIF